MSLDPLDLARSAKHQLVTKSRAAANAVLDPMRRGERTVVMTPEFGMRFGNLLYLWLRSYQSTAQGRLTRALAAPAMSRGRRCSPVCATSPSHGAICGSRTSESRPTTTSTNATASTFAPAHLHDFIGDYLAPQVIPATDDGLVVNVRRGDFYSVESFRETFAFDQVGYLRAALGHIGPVPRLTVVSDDPGWCQDHLDVILRSRGLVPEYAEADPVANFLRVAAARRIIGTNSTFSYWAAYVASWLHDDAQVVMPLFTARTIRGTDAFQLDPSWNAIPGFH